MGREIRRVPPNWEHPKRERGEGYQPIRNESYAKARREWLDGLAAWENGTHPSVAKYGAEYDYWEWVGNPPDRKYFLPEWEEGSATWFQMYETVSEGTPLTPPFATPEELVDYLATHGDSWSKTPMPRATAERFVASGWAPSLVISAERGVQSGVDALFGQPKEPA